MKKMVLLALAATTLAAAPCQAAGTLTAPSGGNSNVLSWFYTFMSGHRG